MGCGAFKWPIFLSACSLCNLILTMILSKCLKTQNIKVVDISLFVLYHLTLPQSEFKRESYAQGSNRCRNYLESDFVN